MRLMVMVIVMMTSFFSRSVFLLSLFLCLIDFRFLRLLKKGKKREEAKRLKRKMMMKRKKKREQHSGLWRLEERRKQKKGNHREVEVEEFEKLIRSLMKESKREKWKRKRGENESVQVCEGEEELLGRGIPRSKMKSIGRRLDDPNLPTPSLLVAAFGILTTSLMFCLIFHEIESF